MGGLWKEANELEKLVAIIPVRPTGVILFLDVKSEEAIPIGKKIPDGQDPAKVAEDLAMEIGLFLPQGVEDVGTTTFLDKTASYGPRNQEYEMHIFVCRRCQGQARGKIKKIFPQTDLDSLQEWMAGIV